MASGDSPRVLVDRKEEFISLLTSHKHQIYNLIFCILHNLPDTEDVFQETCMALWSNFDQFEPGTNFAAWASRTARHRVLYFLRSKRRERQFFSDALIDQLIEGPFDSYELQEARLQALATCRQKLSRSDQQLLAACYGERGRICDAAQKMNRPVQAVYGSLSRIRNVLHACIERKLSAEAHS